MNDENINKRFHLDEQSLRASLSSTPLEQWTNALIEAVNSRDEKLYQGKLPLWQAAIDALPELDIVRVDFDHEHGVAMLTANDQIPPNAANEAAQALESSLKELMPWRKGPFKFAHVNVNTEWRSDWKWNRVYPHITPLKNRTVLDVGCGSGYHMWRMRGQGASTVLGIDPSVLFQMQFAAAQKYINDPAVAMLPLTMEAMPANMRCFDTVFSMGVLYHRKDPHAHLQELMQCIRSGGELVLETLVALGEDENELQIDGRYARMKNIWSLPSVPRLARWMHEAGFSNIDCVSVDITSRLEQRTTEWMPFESLYESLDPENPALTVEGLPRPRRAVMIATAP